MLRIFCVPFFLACFACGTLLLAEEKTKAEPAEMTTKVYKLPFNFMELGRAFVEPAPASPQTPQDPFAPAPPNPPAMGPDPFGGTTLETLTPPPSLPVLTFKSSRKILEEVGMTFPPGASVIFDPVTWGLTLRNTVEMQELAKAFIDTIAGEGGTPVAAFTVTVVEGPGEVIRQANAAVSNHMNAMPQLEALLAEATKPGSGVRIVEEMSLEAKSGTRATAEAVLERAPVEISQTAAAAPPTPPTSQPPPGDKPVEPSWARQDGMSLELEPWLEEDGKTLAVSVALHLGPAHPALEGREGQSVAASAAGKDEGTKTADSQPTPSLRKAGFTTMTRMTNGSAKLIGITRPIGQDTAVKEAGKDRLWAAFLTARVRRVRTLPGAISTPDMTREKLPKGMRAVAFHAPEGLLETGIFAEGISASNLLEDQGVTFPAGASMERRDERLQVVNTPENIEIISSVVDHCWSKARHTVAFTLHTFRVPATLMQQGAATENADDSALLAAVEAATARGEARVVSSAFFEGQSGTRTRHESGLRHSRLTRFGTTPTAGQSGLVFEQMPAGTMLEIEPTVSVDGRTMDLVCMHQIHPAPPASRREPLRATTAAKDHDLPGAEVEVLRTITLTTMASSTTRLLSLCRPCIGVPESAPVPDPFGAPAGSGPGMLWATFLQVHVVPQVEKPRPPPLVPVPELPKEEADIRRIVDKMNKIIIPVVKFEGVSTQKALEFLQAKSRELDTTTEAEGEKGVNIILMESEIPHEDAIYLDLLNVPMSEALRYATELGHCSYRVKADGVRVMHHHSVADELRTRSFRVPKDFLSIGGALSEPEPASASDRKAQKTAKQILESQGITFPEGASAFYSANTTQLLVRNTQPNLDLVEAFLDTRCRWYAAPMALTAQVMQGPGPLLRRIAAQAAPLNNHRALLEELLASVKAGTVQALDTARIETRSGTRATAEQGHDVAALARLTLDGKGGASLGHEPLFSGLHLEAEPTDAGDGIRLTLAAEFHTAPPVLREEHLIDDQGRRFDFPLTYTHRAQLTTGLTLMDGHTRLLHLWKPTGSPELEEEDVLQVMFITGNLLWVGE